jgi:hypothetical protein
MPINGGKRKGAKCIKKIMYLFVVILFVACDQNSKKEEKPVVIDINLEKNQNRESIVDFQNRFSINRIIPLETTDVSLLGNISQLIVTEKDIFILDGMQQAVFHYGIDGNFIRKIQHQGNGPQEYIRVRQIAIANSKLYVLDNMGKSILQYDLEGNYISRFTLNHNGYQMLVDQSENMIVTGSYLNEYMLYIYDSSGQNIANYFPREDKFVGLTLTQTTDYSLKFYNGGFYCTNYFDPTIYYIKENEVKSLAVFDFGGNNLAKDFFANPQAVMDLFTEYRDKSVMGISNLTVTDDWIIFSPEKGRDFYVVYYDRKKNSYMTNRGFDILYATFFGKYNAPNGYTKTNEFYSAVGNWELCEMIEELREKDKDYLSKYPFLQGIDPAKLKENDNNPSIVFYDIK